MPFEAMYPGRHLVFLESLELVPVATKSGRTYQALRAEFCNDLGQRAVLITPDHPYAVMGLLRELGGDKCAQPITPDALNQLCGKVFAIRIIWVYEGKAQPIVTVASVSAVERVRA